ncbi:MAG: carbamoyltransferase HypF [Clostridia bacterium]
MAGVKDRSGIARVRLAVKGVVQGVGFRPFVYRVATAHHLGGRIFNGQGEVVVEVEGTAEQIEAFLHALLSQAREPIRIESLRQEWMEPLGETEFLIDLSRMANSSASANSVIPPDLAMCVACLDDMQEEQSRFFHYPFTSCTDCGPRYTVIGSLPYDRERTTLAAFPLCGECQAEYDDPSNRRFHAQAIACPHCGPQIWLIQGETLEETRGGKYLEAADQVLQSGQILAVKGIGGFHLVCDAAHPHAVERLRQRKHRPRKPLAIMVSDLREAERHFELSEKERQALTSSQAPIVLLVPRATLRERLPLQLLAPGMSRVGVMLPYSPLHRMICNDSNPFLVVTSGNRSGSPLARTNEEALAELDGIADAFLLHDREILIRADDSVVQEADGHICLIRRSRGYVPDAMRIPLPDGMTRQPVVLGAGGDLKNTFCLLQDGQAINSHHIGEVEQLESVENYRQSVAHMVQLLGLAPAVIGYDPHPHFRVSREVLQLEPEAQAFPVYHHHAHMVSCMAEHQLTGEVIGCILDGTGYGPDDTIWGCEILVGGYTSFHRAYSLRPLPLPGGEAAIRQPWMTALACLHDALSDEAKWLEWAHRLFPEQAGKLPLVSAQLDGRLPLTRVSSTGRLFDAVSACLGLCLESSYEGEAAIVLGELAVDGGGGGVHLETEAAYPFECTHEQWDVRPLFRAVLDDLLSQQPLSLISRRFHHTVALMVANGASKVREATGLHSVVLSGGVWNNRYLLKCTKRLLVEAGFNVYTHQNIPTGDGGIALGQAVCALWRWHQEHVSVCTGESH